MFEEVFSDMQVPWIQNYVLRSHLKQDVDALKNPNNYSRAMFAISMHKSIPQLSNGFDAKVFYLRYEVPFLSIGHVGVGVGIRNTKVEDSGVVMYPNGNEFFRFVYNNENNTHLLIYLRQGECEPIDASYQSVQNGLWKFAKLKLNRRLFLGAFDEETCEINFDAINRSLIQSITGFNFFHGKPRIIANHLFPNTVVDMSGENVLQTVFCSYSDSHPMMSFRAIGYASNSFNYDAHFLRNMQCWGITDRLQKMQIGRVQEISDKPLGLFPHEIIEEEGKGGAEKCSK